MIDNVKQYNPPYVSRSKMEQLFNILSTRNLSEISVTDLLNRGFSKSDSFQSIQALKFLNFIDTEGKATENIRVLGMKGEGKKEKLQAITKAAYAKIFETLPNIELISKNELHDEFMAVYGLSSRLAETAVPNFLWLCMEAGIEVSDIPETRTRKPRISNVILHQKDKKKEEKGAVILDNSVQVGEFKLILPPTWDLDEARKAIAKGVFKEVYEELEKLSTKLEKQTENNSDAG